MSGITWRSRGGRKDERKARETLWSAPVQRMVRPIYNLQNQHPIQGYFEDIPNTKSMPEGNYR